MRTIDIRTTQNVTITYELALVRDRIFAFLIDVIALLVAIGILVFIFEMLGGWSRDLETAFYFLVILPLFLFYTLVFEFLANGRTLEKWRCSSRWSSSTVPSSSLEITCSAGCFA